MTELGTMREVWQGIAFRRIFRETEIVQAPRKCDGFEIVSITDTKSSGFLKQWRKMDACTDAVRESWCFFGGHESKDAKARMNFGFWILDEDQERDAPATTHQPLEEVFRLPLARWAVVRWDEEQARESVEISADGFQSLSQGNNLGLHHIPDKFGIGGVVSMNQTIAKAYDSGDFRNGLDR